MKRDAAANDDRPSDFCFGTKQLLRRQSHNLSRCASPPVAAMQYRKVTTKLQCNVAPQNTLATNLDQLPRLEIKMFSRYQRCTLDLIISSKLFTKWRLGKAETQKFQDRMVLNLSGRF